MISDTPEAPQGRRWTVIPLLLLLLGPASRGQQILYKEYSPKDGLPDSRVAPIIQDRAGYLWMGTQAGVTRYDGQEFHNVFQAEEIPGIFGRFILQDHVGALWFAYSGFRMGGATRLQYGTSLTISRRNGLIGNQAFSMTEDRAGDLWIATDAALNRVHFQDSARTTFTITALPDSGLFAVHLDSRGVLWVADKNGLAVLDRDTLRFVYHSGKHQPEWHIRPYSWFDTPDGSLWMSGIYGAYVYRNGTLTHYTTQHGLPDKGVWCFCNDIQGRIWAGTMHGLCRVDTAGGELRFTRIPSFGDVVVYAMLRDREGSLWLATTPGLRKLISADLVGNFKGQDALSSQGIGPIARDGGNSMYFGSRSSGLFVLSKAGIQNIRAKGDLSGRTVTCICPDQQGVVWCGLWRGGVLRVHGSETRLFNVHDGLPGENVHAITRSRQAGLAIGTADGLAFMTEPGKFHRVPPLDSVSVFDVKAVPSPPNAERESLWVATNHGPRLLTLRQGAVESCRDFPQFPAPSRTIIYEILVDSESRVWFGTDGAGLVELVGGTFRRLKTEDGLLADRVYALAEDSLREIWIGTPSGLSRFDGAAFKNYSFDQGFGEIGVHGLLADPEGNVWVSSVPGVLRLRPSSMHRSMTQPPVFITSVQVDQEPLDPNRSYELGPDRAVISFRFAGLSFTDEQNVRYRYRLLGFDREWSPPVTTREIRYTHLPGGTYEFEVLARSGDGIWDEEPARFAFTVLPPLWARWWFILLVLGTLAALTYLSYRYRLAKALELERTRSRIAMDLHDDIGSSLTRVSIMAEVARRQAAVDPAAVESSLARIGDTARELIDALSDIVWSVDPRHDDLLNVIRRIVQFGQEVCEGRGIGFETDLSGSFGSARLSPEQRRDIYLVFKEGIHNVVKHSGATRARFRVHPTGRGALLELLDDGAGIPDDAEGTGHGLISLRERGNRAGCAFSMTSKPGEGTRIALEVKTA